MDVYIKNNIDNDNDVNNSNNNINSNISPQLQKVYENYDNISTEKIKEIEPYYDDDLDQYLNINELKSAINYNSSYNCKNTSSDPENHKNIQLKTQNNCIYYPHPEQYSSYSTQNNQYYSQQQQQPHQQQPHQQQPHQQQQQQSIPINYNKYIHEKKQNINNSKYQDNITDADKINIFYKNMINIGLFIFIGIFIIFVLDQITELAVHIGMKKTLDTLLPILEDLKNIKQNNKNSPISKISNAINY